MSAADGPGTARAAAKHVRVFGIGNPDRGDDGVGMAVLHALGCRSLTDVDLAAKSGDMLALIDDLDSGDAIICIDAAAGNVPGRIHRIDLGKEELPRDVAFVSGHAFGLPEVFALARTLRLMPKEVVVYAIEGTSFDHGAPLSEAVAAVVDDVADRIVAEVGRLRGRTAEASAGA